MLNTILLIENKYINTIERIEKTRIDNTYPDKIFVLG